MEKPGWLDGQLTILGYNWPLRQVFTILLAAVCVAALAAWLKYSSFGRRIRATVHNRDLAETAGISTRTVDRLTFFVGSGLAGVAGVAASLIGGTNSQMGAQYIIPAFLVVAAGGIGQLKGTVIAAWAVGVALSCFAYWTTGSLAQVLAFILVIVPPRLPAGPVHSEPGVWHDQAEAMDLPQRHQGSPSCSSGRSPVSPITGSTTWQVLLLGDRAIGIGLAWGRGGMLVIGQGCSSPSAPTRWPCTSRWRPPVTGSGFMVLYDPLAPLPAFWEPFRSAAFTLLAIVLLPVIVAGLLGYALFKRRVKGAYLAILTQALAVALATLISSTIRETGGDTGLSDFKYFFGFVLNDPANRNMVYLIAAGLLVVCLLVVWQLYRSRFGELLVATQDAEERVRFLGYDPANIKLVAFVVSALMASIGGAMFVPIVGIITPAEIGAAASILMIAGVAFGGRASLFGPALGAMAVGWGQSSLGSTWPDGWNYIIGLLFIVVILVLPGGLSSVLARFTAARRSPGEQPLATRRLEGAVATDASSLSRISTSSSGFVAVGGAPGRAPAGSGSSSARTAAGRPADAITGLTKGTGSATRRAELLGKQVHKIVRLGMTAFQTASVFDSHRAAKPRHRPGLTGPGLAAAGPAASTRRSSRRWRRWIAPSSPRRPASCRMARSSGWRSRCCSCRTRGCCCSTSPSPA